MTEQAKVSVIIVTYRSETTTAECLRSVVEETVSKEVIVVDNASTDRTVAIVSAFPEVRLTPNKVNVGFGAACNQGARQANGEFVFFLNPDAFLENGSLERLVLYLERNPKVAVVGPRILNSDGSLQRGMTPFPRFTDQTLILLKLHRLWPLSLLVYPNHDYGKLQEADHLMGSALLIRKDVFDSLTGFDENYFMWFEEVDLLYRIKRAGWSVVYNPLATVTHVGGVSTSQLSPLRRQLLWNRSLIYYFEKNVGRFRLVCLLPFIAVSFIPTLFLSLRTLRKEARRRGKNSFTED